MKSIKLKISISMISILMALAIILGGVSSYINYSSTLDTLEHTLTETAKVSANQVTAKLEAYKNIAMETGMESRLSSIEFTAESKKELLNLRVVQHGFESASMVDTNGLSVLNDGLDISGREYFKEAVSGKAVVSDPVVSQATGKIVITVAAPVWQGGDPNAKIAGVILYVADGTFLCDIVRTIKIGDLGTAYIADRNGTTIADYVDDTVLSQWNTQEEVKKDESLRELADLELNMIKGETGFGEYSYGGNRKFMSYAPIPDSNSWSVAITTGYKEFMNSTFTGIFLIVVLSLVMILVGVIVAMRLASGISTPIRQCAERLELLAGGDLKTAVPDIKSEDETGVLSSATERIVTTVDTIIGDLVYGLEEMGNGNFSVDSKVKEAYVGDFVPLAVSMYAIMSRLSGTLLQIDQSANQVSAGSEQVSSGSQALSQGATEQASSVEELAATITEISQQVHDNADNANMASEKMEATSRDIDESNKKMQELIEAMAGISQSSEEIGKVIKTIEDIAFQTNILALNAAVEAARAGTDGKGFAVVADEVRNLASKSAQAAKGTTALIEGSVQAVARGTRLADDTAKSLSSVVSTANEALHIIDKISRAAGDQANAIAQVTTGVDQIALVVQNNSATAQESAAASEELSGQATMLKDLISRFKLKDDSDQTGE